MSTINELSDELSEVREDQSSKRHTAQAFRRRAGELREKISHLEDEVEEAATQVALGEGDEDRVDALRRDRKRAREKLEKIEKKQAAHSRAADQLRKRASELSERLDAARERQAQEEHREALAETAEALRTFLTANRRLREIEDHMTAAGQDYHLQTPKNEPVAWPEDPPYEGPLKKGQFSDVQTAEDWLEKVAETARISVNGAAEPATA